MRTLLLMGLIVSTGFAQAPDSVSGKIFQELDPQLEAPVGWIYMLVSLRADNSFATITVESASGIVDLMERKTTVAKQVEGTYVYERTGPDTGTLTFTSASWNVWQQALVFTSESAGIIFGRGTSDYDKTFYLGSIEDAPVVNASARGWASASKPLILGFYVSGHPRQVLVRAIGPSLTQFDVPDAADDTALEIVQPTPPPGYQQFRADNDDWETDAYHVLGTGALLPAVTIGQFMGAFPLAEGSRDSALTWWLYPGAYTVIIRTKSETPKEVLGEVYIVP